MAGASFFLQLFSLSQLRRRGEDSPELSAGKPLAVLTYLALLGKPVTRDALASLLWPDADRGHARASVRQALWTLRQALGQECFASDDPVILAEDCVETDVRLFEEALDSDDLESADELWTGPPLEDLEFPGARAWLHWVEEERSRLERRFGEALATKAASQLDNGQPKAAARWLARAVEVNPYDGFHRVALVEAFIQGRQFSRAADALAEAKHALAEDDDQGILEEMGERLAALRMGAFYVEEPRALRTAFVGRASEFSKLSRKWRRVQDGSSEIGLIVGPPGIGKTRLAQELAALVQSDGGTVVSVKAVEVERSLGWGIASEIVRGFHTLPGAAGISNRSAGVLAQLVPSLAGSKAGFTLSGESHRMEPAAVTDALMDLVGAVAEESPTLLLVDDLQWIDKNSRAALSQMARANTSEPLFILITCRTGEKDPEVEKALHSLTRIPDADPVELGPLDPSEVSELLVLLLDGVEDDDLHTLSTRIFGVTQGNPLFIVEILKLLQAEVLLAPNGNGKWRIDPDCLAGPLPVPATVESAIERRLRDLGGYARLLAAHLASHARAVPAEELRRLSRLDPFDMSEGLRELFERDLARRTPDGRLQLVHDSVADAARRHLHPPGWREHGNAFERWTRRWLKTVAVAPLVAVAMLALLVAVATPGGRSFFGGLLAGPGPTFPHGQGRVFVLLDSGAAVLVPPSREGEGWEMSVADRPFPHAMLDGPFRTAGDSVLWFAVTSDGPEGPPFAGYPLPDGTVEPIWRIEGDVGFKDLSPDGRFVLLVQENLQSDRYRQSLIAVDRATGEARTLFEGSDYVLAGDWSPNGQRIALVSRARQDTLRFITPSGAPVADFVSPDSDDLAQVRWCQDSDHVVFQTIVDGAPRLGMYCLSAGEYSLIPSTLPGLGHPECVGAASAVLARAVVGLQPGAVVLDPNSGEEIVLPVMPGGGVTRFRWVPDRVIPVVQGLKVMEGDVSLPLGDQMVLTPMGRYTDGVNRLVSVSWWSEDPGLASVDSLGRVTANRAGTVDVVAQFAGWMEDTVRVEITPGQHPDVLFRDEFRSGGLSRWLPFGHPYPEVIEIEGDAVLSLTGDGRYHDGVIARETFDVRAGATAEMEFRIPLTRRDRQRVGICLERADEYLGTTREEWIGQTSGTAACLMYPAQENVKFSEQEAYLSVQRLGLHHLVRLPETIDSRNWTHMALQLRADGVISAVFERAVVLEHEVPLSIQDPAHWRVRVYGAAADTHAYVRGVTVWPGERY